MNYDRRQRKPSFLALCGGLLAAAAVGLSAYASHGVGDGQAQSNLQTAALFGFGHGLALAALGAGTTRRMGKAALSLLLLGTLAFLADADAASGLCANGQCLAEPTSTSIDPDERLLDFAAAHRLTGADAGLSRRAALSRQEFYSFSGVGAVVCMVDGEQRMSTAFLVGAFDIGVTVAHTFAN